MKHIWQAMEMRCIHFLAFARRAASGDRIRIHEVSAEIRGYLYHCDKPYPFRTGLYDALLHAGVIAARPFRISNLAKQE